MEPNTWVSAKTSTTQVKKAPQRGTALRAALVGILAGAGASLQLVKRGQYCLLVLGIPDGSDVGCGKAEPASWRMCISSSS